MTLEELAKHKLVKQKEAEWEKKIKALRKRQEKVRLLHIDPISFSVFFMREALGNKTLSIKRLK